MGKMIHSMIRVRDEARSVAFYDKAFGLKIVGRYAFDGFTLVYLANDKTDFELELTVNADQAEPYDLGNGYGHLAISVCDLEVEHARLKALNLDVAIGAIKEMPFEGNPFAKFFFITDPDGYKIEVLERGGRFQ